MSISRGMDKEMVAYSYSMEYYSTIKMNKVLIYVTTWINLKKLRRLLEEVRYQLEDCIDGKLWGRHN